MDFPKLQETVEPASPAAVGILTMEPPGKSRKIPSTHIAEYLHFTDEQPEALGEYSDLLKAAMLFSSISSLDDSPSKQIKFSQGFHPLRCKILFILLKHLKAL